MNHQRREMIKNLTQEQWAQIPIIRQRVYDMCIAPRNEEKETEAVKALYENAGLEPPKKIIWCKSPLEGVLLISLMKGEANLRANLRDNLGENLWDNLWDNLRDNLGSNLRENLRENLRDNLWENLGENLWVNLWDNLRDNLGSNLRKNLRGNLWNFYYLYYEKSYLGYFLGGEMVGLDLPELGRYQLIVENLDVIAPYKDLCIICDRPTYIGWHDAGGIHCEDGAAVRYADGYEIWALEGYQVPKYVVLNPETQTIEEIQLEENEEVKRIRIQQYGWSKYLEALNAEVLDVSIPPYGGMESLMACNGYTVLCTYDPSTGRPYSLEVDPDCKSCEEAQRYLLAPELAFEGLGIDHSKIQTYSTIRT